jgi:hypothetical protein
MCRTVVALSKNYKNQFHFLTVFFTDFITFLLQKIGTYVDPQILVKRIESGLEIPGLKNSLVKMMQDYNLQVLEVFLTASSQTDMLEHFVTGTVLYFLLISGNVIASAADQFAVSFYMSYNFLSFTHSSYTDLQIFQ